MFKALFADFKVTALDVRSHGGSVAITEGFTFRQLAKDIVAVTQQLGLKKPIYSGHSMGGLLGLVSELESPGLFRALALLAPASGNGTAGTDEEMLKSVVQNHGNRVQMANNYRPMYVKSISDEALAAVVDAASLVPKSVHEYYILDEFPNFNIVDRLHEIEAPVLFINGAMDKVIPSSEQHDAASRLQRFKEVILSDEGHMLPLESPKRVAAEINHFYEYDLKLQG